MESVRKHFNGDDTPVNLNTGVQLGIYKIVGLLGAGGMGQVYRAHDSKLDREVAIKVLPDSMAHAPESLARFEREAKLLASLSHPQIAAIYGFEEANEKHFLVLELVEGLSLAERIAKESLTVEESRNVAQQIAEALDAAHEKGIVHRDLKPANVMITPDDQVKVLDFGLAKAMAEEGTESNPATSPTLTDNFTRPGVILGTAAYMSPEQARGRPVDKRTDIWSFGCVLYECLVGRPAFQGGTITDLLGAVLKDEPDWDALPDDTPQAMKQLLQRLLVKDRKGRLRDMGDVSILLKDETSADDATESLTRGAIGTGKRWMTYGGWAVAACVAIASVCFYASGIRPNTRSTPEIPARLHLTIDQDRPFRQPVEGVQHSVALSPDGRWIAYIGGDVTERRLYYRRIDEFKWRVVSNSEGAHSPFFSPNGERLAFFSIDELKVATLATNERPQPVTETIRIAAGGCWEDDETILFLPTPTLPLTRVDVSSGDKTDVFADDKIVLFAPRILPDGSGALIVFAPRGEWGKGQSIGVVDFETRALKPLDLKGTSPYFDEASGRLVYANDGNILSVPFDIEHAEITGPSELLEAGVSQAGVAEFGLSHHGRLLYAPGTDRKERKLVSIDPEPSLDQPEELFVGDIGSTLRLRPNDQTLALHVNVEGALPGLRQFHLDPPELDHQLIDSHSGSGHPTWAPDGASLAYMSALGIYSIEFGGAAADESMFDGMGSGADFPTCWHPQEEVLLYTDEDLVSHWDIGLYDKTTGEKSYFVKTNSVETGAVFSPDGKWVAYQSNIGGRFEIYIKPYPLEPGFPIRVSSGGGIEPMWSPKTAPLQLYYRIGQKMMSVDFLPGQTPQCTDPVELFRGHYAAGEVRASYDVDQDGRFYMVELSEKESPKELNMIVDWNAKYLTR